MLSNAGHTGLLDYLGHPILYSHNLPTYGTPIGQHRLNPYSSGPEWNPSHTMTVWYGLIWNPCPNHRIHIKHEWTVKIL